MNFKYSKPGINLKALVAICCVLIAHTGKVIAQNYEGNEFHFAFINNIVPFINQPPTFDICIQAVEDAAVTVEFGQPGDPFYLSQNLFVAAGNSGLITFPTGFLYQQNYFEINRSTFKASATGLVRLYVFHNRQFFSEASAILPSDALGTQYRVLSLPAQSVVIQNSSICKIVAVEDDTEIEVTTNIATPLGPAGVPAIVTLNAQEAISIAAPPPQDLTGTLINSVSGKPIAAFSGNDAVLVGPDNCLASSHVYEQLTPVSNWGTVHPIIPTAGAGGDYVRILASTNGTELYNGCEFLATINAGQTYNAYFEDAFVLYSSAPVMVGMFTVGYECSNLSAGDPNLRILLPFEKALLEVRMQSSYFLNEDFLGVPQNSFWFLNVAMPTDQTDQIEVNGGPVTNWQAFTSLPEMSYTSVPILDVAVQELVAISTVPFWGELVGLGPADAKTMSLGTTTLMQIPELGELVVDLGPDFDICQGEEVLLDPGLGIAGTWQDGSVQETFLVTQAGVYTVSIPGACNQSGAEVVVGIAPGPSIDLPANYTVCESETVQIGVETTTGVNYTWSSGQSSSTITVSEAGTYLLTASAGEGCVATAETVVEFIPLPVVTIEAPEALCGGGSGVIVAQANTGGTYLWSNGSSLSSIEINSAGIFSITFTSTDGCQTQASVSVPELPEPLLEILGPETICPGQSAVLVALFGNGTLTWDDGNTRSERIITLPGIYQATLVGEGGCTGTAGVVVEALSLPEILVSDASICEGSSILLLASAPGAQLQWQNAPPGNTLEVNAAGDYTVEAVNDCGAITATAKVEVRDCSCPVYVPNAFSPNSDGLNDIFLPSIGCEPISYELRIFDRWGIEVFLSNDTSIGWNGSGSGTTHYGDVGIYQWVMRYANPKLPATETVLLRGTVMLVR